MKTYTFVILMGLLFLYALEMGIIIGLFGQEKMRKYGGRDLFLVFAMFILIGMALFMEILK